MSDKYFIDTNIFVYCFDDRQPDKRVRSLALIADALQSGNGMISWQVIQEFLNVSTRKFNVPLKPEDAKIYLQKVLNPLCKIFPDLDLFSNALDILEETRYSFYDSLIIAGAERGGCELLYSEDLQAGRKVNGVVIVNPFV
ncbi:MAG: PIN domain-containing protein [Leptolinea sp.]